MAEKTKGDHAIAVAKAGVALIPVVGGTISSLMDDYIPTARQKSLDSTIEILKERVGKIEGRIDDEIADKDEFSELFMGTMNSVSHTTKEEKFKIAAGILTNSLLKKDDSSKLEYDELDHYAKSLDTLSIGAIGVLGKAYDIVMSMQGASKYVVNNSYQFNFKKLSEVITSKPPVFIMALVSELSGAGLLRIAGVPTVQTADYANYPLELTSLGSKFVKYLLRGEM